jgi:hypothetical protein
MHAPWLRRQIPFIRILISEQSRFNLRLGTPCPPNWIKKLRGIGSPAAPVMAAGEERGSKRSVQHPHPLPSSGADDVPLQPAEVPRFRHQRERLLTSLEGQIQQAAIV